MDATNTVTPPPPSPDTVQPYLAPAVPRSIPLFYLFLLLLPLFLGGGLCEVLGLAELLGGLRHGAAVAAGVTVAPALLSFVLPPVPSPFPLFPLSPRIPVTHRFVSGGHHDMRVHKASSRYLCG